MSSLLLDAPITSITVICPCGCNCSTRANVPTLVRIQAVYTNGAAIRFPWLMRWRFWLQKPRGLVTSVELADKRRIRFYEPTKALYSRGLLVIPAAWMYLAPSERKVAS